MKNKYKIIALCGEAGCGKDYIMKKVLAACPIELNEIISTTTRPKRENEQEGVNYFYVTPEQFAEKLLNDEMFEATLFNSWGYGTERKALRTDIPNIGVFNPEGIYILKSNKDIELTIYKISCKDKIRLIRQLNREENPNVEEIIRRYQTDSLDFLDLDFDYIELSNNTPEEGEVSVKTILDKLN